ncbi:MAG: UDP-N-acetylmuramyl-tripeptide synthetase [Candidatus Shapirobacteria bacterium]|nr:UDP-N-acetylmuramyl-tripeptide synthetase [Candidatus Shapirobacteria bacterium]
MFHCLNRYYFQKLKNYLWHLPRSIFFNLLYSFPQRKLVLIGVTGTDGKTTTTTLIHHTLIAAGIKSDFITTINSPGLHTTSPDAQHLIPIFAKMVKEGTTHAVIETTAHGLDQFRYWGCCFQVGVITNITHEHFDDFVDMHRYTHAKSLLFKNSEVSVLNKDDPSFPALKSVAKKKIVSFGIANKSDYQANNIKITGSRLSFSVNDFFITTNSNYYYQIYNILAALAATNSLGIDPKYLIELVLHFPEVKGRRENIINDLNIDTIIDFAHTPQALQSTLESLRLTTKGKIIVIFGATGGRDPTKRPLMGEVVSHLADIAIITADDTRSESVDNINEQIIAGIDQTAISQKKFRYYNIPNRQDAFNLAIRIANPKDTVIACGKGHETTILHGSTEYPWSEAEAFRTAFRTKNQNV